jgi:hypothetical protein
MITNATCTLGRVTLRVSQLTGSAEGGCAVVEKYFLPSEISQVSVV